MKSENATANPMANVATENVAETVQDIVEELGETHTGRDPQEVVEAVQEKWTEKQGDVIPPLPEDTATELAEHISEGNDVTVIPEEEASSGTTPPTGS